MIIENYRFHEISILHRFSYALSLLTESNDSDLYIQNRFLTTKPLPENSYPAPTPRRPDADPTPTRRRPDADRTPAGRKMIQYALKKGRKKPSLSHPGIKVRPASASASRAGAEIFFCFFFIFSIF